MKDKKEMLVKSKNSDYLHYPECRCIKYIKEENKIYYNNRKEAFIADHNTKMCKYCAKIYIYYNREKEEIEKYAKENGIKMEIKDWYIQLQSELSLWKISAYGHNGKYKLVLYHQDGHVKFKDVKKRNGKPVYTFHEQESAKRCRSIMDILKYVKEHDYWKTYGRYEKYSADKNRSKKYKNKYNKEKKKANTLKIRRVCDLIEQLQYEDSLKRIK